MESCQTEGDGKLFCLCLKREGLGISAEQLIPACNLYHPCCCYCLCGIRGRLKECQHVPAGPSTVAVTSALSAFRRSRISLAFCLAPILIPAPPSLYRPLLDNQEATEKCIGGDGGEQKGAVSASHSGSEGGSGAQDKIQLWEQKKCPTLSQIPHTGSPLVLTKLLQHH